MGATLFRLTQDDNFSVDLSNQQLDDYNENSEYARQKILSEVKSRLDERSFLSRYVKGKEYSTVFENYHSGNFTAC